MHRVLEKVEISKPAVLSAHPIHMEGTTPPEGTQVVSGVLLVCGVLDSAAFWIVTRASHYISNRRKVRFKRTLRVVLGRVVLYQSTLSDGIARPLGLSKRSVEGLGSLLKLWLNPCTLMSFCLLWGGYALGCVNATYYQCEFKLYGRSASAISYQRRYAKYRTGNVAILCSRTKLDPLVFTQTLV